jgi:phosphoribosylamine--glycine ligase
MLTPDGPRVLEFNVRFGDPETQVVLPRLEGDLTGLLAEVASGSLQTRPRFADTAAVCVVMASEGYPESPRTGDPITGLDAAAGVEGVTVFHAGTATAPGAVSPRGAGQPAVVTAGGRVLSVTALAPTIGEARARAYRGVGCISWPGAHARTDIAREAASSPAVDDLVATSAEAVPR